MVSCRTFHTAPEQVTRGRHLLSPIVLVPVPVPVPLPDTTSVITPLKLVYIDEKTKATLPSQRNRFYVRFEQQQISKKNSLSL